MALTTRKERASVAAHEKATHTPVGNLLLVSHSFYDHLFIKS